MHEPTDMLTILLQLAKANRKMKRAQQLQYFLACLGLLHNNSGVEKRAIHSPLLLPAMYSVLLSCLPQQIYLAAFSACEANAIWIQHYAKNSLIDPWRCMYYIIEWYQLLSDCHCEIHC